MSTPRFFNACLFENGNYCSFHHIVIQMPRNGHNTRFYRMGILPVISSNPFEIPSIRFDYFYDLSNLHDDFPTIELLFGSLI